MAVETYRRKHRASQPLLHGKRKSLLLPAPAAVRLQLFAKKSPQALSTSSARLVIEVYAPILVQHISYLQRTALRATKHSKHKKIKLNLESFWNKYRYKLNHSFINSWVTQGHPIHVCTSTTHNLAMCTIMCATAVSFSMPHFSFEGDPLNQGFQPCWGIHNE